MTHTKPDQYETLFPILAISVSILLGIFVLRSYQKTNAMQPTIVLPAGGTYVGK